MANTIKHKRASGSDPSASDLVVGELAIRTDTGVVFTKKDDNSVAEIAGGGGASDIDGLSDAVTFDSGTGVGLGTGALANDDGSDNDNTALGYNAGNATTSGDGNVLVGYEAGSGRTTIGKATCVGFEAGRYPSSYHITAIGYQALKGSSSSNNVINNTAVGYQAGLNVQSASFTGSRNTFLGYSSGSGVTSGNSNVFIGALSADHCTTGTGNIVIGQDCASGGTEYARRLTTGGNNIILGNLAEASASTVSNEITLGNSSITSLRIPGLSVVAQAESFAIGGAIYENAQSISADYSITSGNNAMSAGPITVDSGVTVTVTSGCTWTVV